MLKLKHTCTTHRLNGDLFCSVFFLFVWIFTFHLKIFYTIKPNRREWKIGIIHFNINTFFSLVVFVIVRLLFLCLWCWWYCCINEFLRYTLERLQFFFMYVPFVCLLFAFFVFDVYFLHWFDKHICTYAYTHTCSRDRLRLRLAYTRTHRAGTQTPRQAFYTHRIHRDNAHTTNVHANKHRQACGWVCVGMKLTRSYKTISERGQRCNRLYIVWLQCSSSYIFFSYRWVARICACIRACWRVSVCACVYVKRNEGGNIHTDRQTYIDRICIGLFDF